MKEDQTNVLVESITQELSPVRKIPALRTVLLSVVGAWLLVLLLVLGRSAAKQQIVMPGISAGLVIVALFSLGFFGIIAGLAAAVPGRERLFRNSFRISLLGWFAGIGMSVAYLVVAASSSHASLGDDFMCLAKSGLLGLVPLAMALLFVLRGVGWQLLHSLALVLASCVAMGGIVVQMSCTHLGLRHLLMGHGLAPWAVACLLGVPLFLLLRYYFSSNSH